MVRPPRLVACTWNMLVAPLSMLPKFSGESQTTSASTAPVMVRENGYAALAKIIFAVIAPDAVSKVIETAELGLSLTLN